MLNDATRPADRVQHDTVNVLVGMVLAFYSAMVQCAMWKRDISKAFRRCPVRASHLEFSWVVFRAHGRIWGAQHLGMPFGAASSVYAWVRQFARTSHHSSGILVSYFFANLKKCILLFLAAAGL